MTTLGVILAMALIALVLRYILRSAADQGMVLPMSWFSSSCTMQ